MRGLFAWCPSQASQVARRYRRSTHSARRQLFPCSGQHWHESPTQRRYMHVLLWLPCTVGGLVVALPLNIEFQHAFVEAVPNNLLNNESVPCLVHGL